MSTPQTPPATPEPSVPQVEARIYELERSIALLMLLARACATADDRGMSEKDEAAAWARISTLCDDAMVHIRSIAAVVEAQRGFAWAAPTVTERA